MSVHFRILSADGNTLLDEELEKPTDSVAVSADEVQRLLADSQGDKLTFLVCDASSSKPKHKLPCDWSILDG